MELANFRWDVDADGIATMAWDSPGRSMNVLTASTIADLGLAGERLATDPALNGLVITSAKTNAFCAGAALDEMAATTTRGRAASPDEATIARLHAVMRFHQVLRRLETCGKPVAAAINGLALGGGFEVTLACHYRVVADVPKLRLGLPEAKVGVLPGGGGTQRLPRLIGAMAALQLMLKGETVDVQKALALGMIHAIAPADEIVARAKEWIKSSKDPKQPWDRTDFHVPGGGPYSKSASQVFMMGNAMLRKESFGNYPAQRYIMSCVYEGLLLPIDAACRVEGRYFVKLLGEPESRNMIRSLFLSMQELGKGARRPKSEPTTDVKTLGVLGAGVMGAGIALVAAQAGIEVVLIDTAMERAEAGRATVAGILDRQIAKGRTTEQKKADVLARIHPLVDFAALARADLVIEAVFEDRAVKAEATRKAEAAMRADAIFGSNTSTLPITGLAEASTRPDSFIGIHFFSPVDRMGLVEIILGKRTSPHALAAAIDFVAKIRKTPIVVNDSRGFYTSRCFGTYTREGIAMLAEGIHPAMIENVGRMAGMPMGPLEVMDSVGVDTALRITRQTRKELGREGKDANEDILAWLVEKAGRPGRKTGKGFYDYDAKGKRVRLWPDLVSSRRDWRTDANVEELKSRFLSIQALEAARCFEEGVITDPRDADIGAILGWGFAPFTGGPISYIDTLGTDQFVRRCETFAGLYGDRFRPNRLLHDMAATGQTFYARFAPARQAA